MMSSNFSPQFLWHFFSADYAVMYRDEVIVTTANRNPCGGGQGLRIVPDSRSERVSLDRSLSNSAAAFTLLELLVVIGVISVLAALLLPVLARAKASARRVACMSNMHQIGLTLRSYLDAFQKYPAFQAEADTGARSGYWDSKLLAQGAGTVKIFMCPSLSANGLTVKENWSTGKPDLVVNLNPLPWPNMSYGYNGTGTATEPFPVSLPGGGLFLGFGGEASEGAGPQFAATCVAESKVVAPSDMVAIADYDPQGTDDDGDADRHPEMLFIGLVGRHGRGANGLFCDSHIEYGQTNRWTARANAVWRRWNLDNQPHMNGE